MALRPLYAILALLTLAGLGLAGGANPRARPRAQRPTARAGSGNPSRYEALRPHATYVEYANGEREYYDLASDPYELRNIYPQLSPSRVHALHSRLALLESCRGATSCRHAARR